MLKPGERIQRLTVWNGATKVQVWFSYGTELRWHAREDGTLITEWDRETHVVSNEFRPGQWDAISISTDPEAGGW